MGSVIKADLLGARRPDNDVYLVQQIDEVTGKPKLTPEEMAAIIVHDAEDEAARLIAQAERERESVRAAAYTEGYDAGFRELETERASFEERLGEIEANIDLRLNDYYSAMETELLKLSVEIAGQIVRQKIEGDQEFVLRNVKAGLRQLRERNEIRIRVNPADYEFARGHKDDIAQSCDGIRSVEVTDDRRVEPGGCIIESPNGELDARIETQLTEVERALLEAAHDGRNETGLDAG